ncbi:amidohydrolase family protein [Sphingobium sp. C100]|uniref:amidohydrolase family protein n=1 Tax=Sphingobium sp. C100 TaxID=1207055 RepID=UPI000405BF01|nr:amidohydrolase family protein [Sphingobium sp. C100]
MIDAHQHFWALANPFTAWPTPDLAAIHRDFAPDDLRPLLAQAGVTGTILVQAAPDVDETRFLLGLADAHDFVKGVVGWIDFEAVDALDQLRQLASNPWLKGLRPMIQSIEEPGWVLRSEFDPIFQEMIAQGLRFDALVRAHQIGDIASLAGRYPALPIVLDHGGKPDIVGEAVAGWAADIGRLARHANAHCKLSGLWTEAGDDISPQAIGPYADHLLAAFGVQRLMWGSDWPVVELAGRYGDWLAQARRLLAGLDEAGLAAVFGGNATRFYRVGDE